MYQCSLKLPEFYDTFWNLNMALATLSARLELPSKRWKPWEALRTPLSEGVGNDARVLNPLEPPQLKDTSHTSHTSPGKHAGVREQKKRGAFWTRWYVLNGIAQPLARWSSSKTGVASGFLHHDTSRHNYAGGM